MVLIQNNQKCFFFDCTYLTWQKINFSPQPSCLRSLIPLSSPWQQVCCTQSINANKVLLSIDNYWQTALTGDHCLSLSNVTSFDWH